MFALIFVSLLSYSLDINNYIQHFVGNEREPVCEGYFPDNDLKIPVDKNQNRRINKSEFDRVVKRIRKVYTPIIKNEYGARLIVQGHWNSSEVNAYASQSGRNYYITIKGGFARHREATADSIMQVLCHEVGHHVGGVPRYNYDWASGEGQSDYFATLKCMRKVYTDEENLDWVANNEVDPYASQVCGEVFDTVEDVANCERTTMASVALSRVARDLSGESRYPKLDEPDPRKVSSTNNRHPKPQCRLDTSFAGATCAVPDTVTIGSYDADVGTCSRANGDTIGVRPRCWYRP